MSSLKDDSERLLTEYAYTESGRLKEIRTLEGFRASYEYDGDGNLSHLRIGNEEKGYLLYDAFMVYDLNGNRTGKTGERLGADGKRQEMCIAYSYDLMNRLTEERRASDGDRYSYDPAGNRIRKQHYHYALAVVGNPVRGLDKGITESTSDAVSSTTIDGEESYCYNERNQLTERKNLSGFTEYLYDENGSLISEKEGGKTASYQYDLLNRQTKVKTPDGREQENLYEGEGLRAGIKENEKISAFLYYNGEILAESDGNSEPVRRHLSGLGLSHMEDIATGILHTYHQDEQGSTAYITGRDGAVENGYIYDAFGNVLESRENVRNRILYTGQQYDQEIGQYYLRARYYNPVIGRFTQEDAYRGDGLNLYAYCGNNPVVYYDPDGYAVNGIGVCTKTDQAEYGEQVSGGEGGSNLEKTDFYVTQDGTVISSNKVKPNIQYDRLEVEVYSGKSVRPTNAVDDWDDFLGLDQTDVNPFTGEKSIDRIWSEDGTRSIRFGNHEMDGMGTRNFHYHKETWYDDYVYNEVQRIQQK